MLHFTVRELAFKSEDTSIFGQVEEQLKIEIKNVICDVLDVFCSLLKKTMFEAGLRGRSPTKKQKQSFFKHLNEYFKIRNIIKKYLHAFVLLQPEK